MNGDGAIDIMKQTFLAPPTHVAVGYNDPESPGFFGVFDVVADPNDGVAPLFEELIFLNSETAFPMSAAQYQGRCE